jgi:hypothetical protein
VAVLFSIGRRCADSGVSSCTSLILTVATVHAFFFFLYFQFFFFKVDAYSAKYAHIHIRDPYERKTGNKITTPVIIKQVKACYKEDSYGYIMAETIFAGKKIKEFSFGQPFTFYALPYAKFPWLPEYFFMGNRPCNTGNGNRQQKKVPGLNLNRHNYFFIDGTKWQAQIINSC